MNKLTFGPITVNNGESLKTQVNQSEPSALNSLKEIPVHRSAVSRAWSLPTLLISVEVSRPNKDGVIYKDVAFKVECSELAFNESYECKLKIFEGSQSGWVAEMVSIEGNCANEVPRGDLNIEVSCADMGTSRLTVPLKSSHN